MSRIRMVVIGASQGGLLALRELLAQLPSDFPVPVVIVQHISHNADDSYIRFLDKQTPPVVKEAEDKERMLPGHVYVAPPNYHLLVERDGTLTLSADARVHFCRPSIDVLFESAADATNGNLAGVILTGANKDGSAGLLCLRAAGGIAVVQSPESSDSREMPSAALTLAGADYTGTPEAIGKLLVKLTG